MIQQSYPHRRRRIFDLRQIVGVSSFFQGWSRAQVVLLLGPLAVSAVLVVFHLHGMLPFGWPGLLIAIVLVNVAGDLVYALREQRSVRQGRIRLCNEIIGRQAVAEQSFTGDGHSYRGRVTLAGESWRARGNEPFHAGARVAVAGRHGLVLEVVHVGDTETVPDAADPGEGDALDAQRRAEAAPLR